MGSNTGPVPEKTTGSPVDKSVATTPSGMRISKPVGFQEPPQESLHALAAHQAQTAESPTPDVLEAHRATGTADLFGCGAGGVRSRDNGAGADARDAVDGDAVLFQDAEHTGMSDPTREAATQRYADTNRRW